MTWIKRNQQDWLMAYLQTKCPGSGYKSIQQMLRRFVKHHGFSRQRRTKCKKSQVFLAETRDEFACEFHREYWAYGKECTYNVDDDLNPGPFLYFCNADNAHMELNQRLMAELALQRDQQNQLMAQLEAQHRTTENHDQGLRAAAASSIVQAEALEDMRRRTSARWHAFTATPAPQTVQAPATVGVHMVYEFQEVPKAPTFNGSTKQLYRPAGGERKAFWEIGKPSHELNDEDWHDYFLSARNGDPVDMTKLNLAMGKLKMDGSIISAESRVSKLVSDFEAALVRLNMEGFAETEPKLTVDSLMAAITPLAVPPKFSFYAKFIRSVCANY
ncbi:hypothetical protein DYB32_010033 [Aphanomyces invadans]|uniref:Uncharacterized protein n=1 Tax=Aphanomyces invadans TaxID=157072 RepID=A0A418AGV1_9STRA|nr:hypothetical protein DYB32_010033 [Aphanomyces invadans]